MTGPEVVIAARSELVAAFTAWKKEADHGDFPEHDWTPEEYGAAAAAHLIALIDALRISFD